MNQPLIPDNLFTKGVAGVILAGVLAWAGWVSATLIETEETAKANEEVLRERSNRLQQIFFELGTLETEIENVAENQLETRDLIIEALDLQERIRDRANETERGGGR